MIGMALLNGDRISAQGLTGWAYLPYASGGLLTRVRTGDFATGLALVNAIGARAEAANHHPDLDLRYDHVDVRLTSHDEGGVTERDVELARQIGELASDLTLDATITRYELGLDTPDGAAIAPFWAAILGLPEPAVDADDIVDSSGALTSIWFQPAEDEEPRQRWHPDIWVEADQAAARIEAALAAGGTLVSDEEAPSFWVLADADGNRACICTWQDRGAGLP